jgi:hypothetical protein
MSWLFSQALVEEYLGDTCSDGEPSVPLNGNLTQLAYLPPDKMTAFSRLSRYGMTFKLLTADRGEELLTLYLEDFLAKTSQQPVKEPELTENDPECGHIWQELLARYDRATSSWKTPQCSLLGDYTEFSETWPRWGLMQGGVSYQQQTLVRRTEETESGSWLMPTPTTNPEAPNHGSNSKGPHNLKEVALTGWSPGMQWPTPRSCSAMAATITPESAWAENRFPNLETVVGRRLWPTPQASDNRDRGNMSNPAIQRRVAMGKQIMLSQSVDPNSGQLNPTWVEWLMGWPLGWTDLKPLEMDKYQQWQQQHGDY